MGLFEGKKGLILGVANDYSIAWAISRKLLDEGAELGFTHLPGDKMERRVRKLADPAGAKLVTPCDVQNDDDVASRSSKKPERRTASSTSCCTPTIAFGVPDQRFLIKCPFGSSARVGTGSRRRWTSAFILLTVVSRNAAESMPDGGSILTMSYFGGERVVAGYNLMGVCKAALDMSVRYLAYDLGPKNTPGSTPSLHGLRSRRARRFGRRRRRQARRPVRGGLATGPELHPRGGRLGGHVPPVRSGEGDFRPEINARRLRLQRHGLTRPRDRGGEGRQTDLRTRVRDGHHARPPGRPRRHRPGPPRRRVPRPAAPRRHPPRGLLGIPWGQVPSRGIPPSGPHAASAWKRPGSRCTPSACAGSCATTTTTPGSNSTSSIAHRSTRPPSPTRRPASAGSTSVPWAGLPAPRREPRGRR